VDRELRHAIEYINETMPMEQKIRYCGLDFSQISKNKALNLLKSLDDVAKWVLDQTSIFCASVSYTGVAGGPDGESAFSRCS